MLPPSESGISKAGLSSPSSNYGWAGRVDTLPAPLTGPVSKPILSPGKNWDFLKVVLLPAQCNLRFEFKEK